MSFRQLSWRWLARIGWGLAGVVLSGLYLYYLQAQSMPDPQFWHQEDVAQQIVPELRQFEHESLDTYLEHEARIFSSLAEAIEQIDADLPGWHRYSAAAHAVYVAAWPDSNRTQLLTPPDKRGSVLLVHGLSDSTHSMRTLARSLYQKGFQTLNLRMPGHGTLPGALQNVSWKQFRGAYRLGVRSLVADLEPAQPLILVGYSNGAALAVNYTLSALASGGELRTPDLLVLISPAMQVSPVAAYARIQRWISELPGMEKLGWTNIVPEFDPFKYNSFPVHAAEQIYSLTMALHKNLLALTEEELKRFPRVLAFQSVLDNTIPPGSVVSALLERLGNSPAELVLFDINRNSSMLPLLADRGDRLLEELAGSAELTFDLSIVGNDSENVTAVSVRTRRRGESNWQEMATDMQWPDRVYSLSHVALPFDANDPIYGINKGDGLMRLGELWFKGEQGGLGVPLGLLARQRFNPFFPYLEARVLEAVEQVGDKQTLPRDPRLVLE